MTIAVDFDGTIVEHQYPAIGKERPFATATLRQLIKDGHKLVLWSVREGDLLEQAVKWCEERGVYFYAANQDIGENDKDMQKSSSYSRKLKVQMFIDDRNVGGLPDWGVIYQLITHKLSLEQYYQKQLAETTPRKKPWWKRLF
ncbi:MAG: hypothetical protein SPE09_09240 [Alloprevotella sp.]|nr:hypothetical protein [Alloprevotella sp.]